LRGVYSLVNLNSKMQFMHKNNSLESYLFLKVDCGSIFLLYETQAKTVNY